jgi:IS30 family transposase
MPRPVSRPIHFVFYISPDEKDTLEAIIKEGSMSRAADRLNARPSTLSMRLRRLRMRYQKAKEFIEAVDYYKRKMPGRYL